MEIIKHIPNKVNKNKRINFVEIDMFNDKTNEIFGFSLDEDLNIIGRVIIKTSNNDKYKKLKCLLSKGCDIFNVYGKIVHIF